MKKKKRKLKWLTEAEISQFLKEQQEVVGIVDDYIRPILLDTDNSYYIDFAMQHIFVNIRNSYQDGIVLSQKLMKNDPYYVSTALAHAQRMAQDFLIDLAYIMSDFKHKSGNEYLRYLKYILTVDSEENKRLGLDNTSVENLLKKNFPPDLKLPKRGTQWTKTSRDVKKERGLKLYKIESPDFADFRVEYHKGLSSTAHGNENTTYTLTRTPEENLRKLRADLTMSIGYFDGVLESALKCYVQLYLGRNNDYREIADRCGIRQGE